MDHRNGGDHHLAPPRPPKCISRVYRPRAPEPENAVSLFNDNLVPASHQPTIKMNYSSVNPINVSLNSLTPTSSNHRVTRTIPPATAPLTPLQNIRNTNLNSNSNVSSALSNFSTRRAEMPQQRILASSPVPSVIRSLTPSSIVAPTASNFISNAISTVARGSPSPVNCVTLQIPRPENERFPNEYVDTPFANNSKLITPSSRSLLATTAVPTNRILLNGLTTNISTIDGILMLNHNNINDNDNNNININDNINNNNSNNNNNINNCNKLVLPIRISADQRPNLLPITKQPSCRNTLIKKDTNLHQQFSRNENGTLSSQNTINSGFSMSTSDRLNTIRCPQCNRCRCEECKRPRQLPSKWFCDNNCFCSAETVIDYASCLCCVKALFYHCSKDYELDCENESIRCAEDPCSCVPYKRSSRWGCLSFLSVLLPCLCCYWPMRGCVTLCASCYARYSRHGCRCNTNVSIGSTNSSFNCRQNIISLTPPTGQAQPQTNLRQNQSNNDLTPEKRLLDSPDF